MTKDVAHSTAVMREVVRGAFERPPENTHAPRFAVLEEVPPSTGFGGTVGYADVVVCQFWPSDGLHVHGYELKASKSDLRRELADLTKWRNVGDYCDWWTLVVWDRQWVDGLDLPEEWGVAEANGNGFSTVRRPKKLTPKPWPRGFALSMVRRALALSPSASFCARVADAAREDGERTGNELGRADERAKIAAQLAGWLPLGEEERAHDRLWEAVDVVAVAARHAPEPQKAPA